VVDNTGFNAAAKWCRENDGVLVPVFAFPPEQIDPSHNKYFSTPAVQFMCESLVDLNAALLKLSNNITGLHMMKGTESDVLESIRTSTPSGFTLTDVFSNQDYSVYAKARDQKIADWCKDNDVIFHGDIEDYDLLPITEGLLPDGRPYTNLSQYFAKFTKNLVQVRAPTSRLKLDNKHFAKLNLNAVVDLEKLYTYSPDLAQKGGRSQGRKILKKIADGTFDAYGEERDYPALDRTTKASAHLHFGTISIREMYHAAHKNSELIREHVFRSFYLKIYSLKPELQRGIAFHKDVDEQLKPSYVSTHAPSWKAWTEGQTGYPLVDAGMRQLAKEGWVHNRVRMLVAVFATRYLLHDWRDCARFFYTKLVDADTFSNTAGWQWSAGIGPDAAPYFRAAMNPYIQSKKFDADAVYIKRWIPELADVAAKDIHRWDEEKVRAKYPNCAYSAPIIGQKEASKRAVDLMKAAHARAK